MMVVFAYFLGVGELMVSSDVILGGILAERSDTGMSYFLGLGGRKWVSVEVGHMTNGCLFGHVEGR